MAFYSFLNGMDRRGMMKTNEKIQLSGRLK